jgi:hypothetical protein
MQFSYGWMIRLGVRPQTLHALAGRTGLMTAAGPIDDYHSPWPSSLGRTVTVPRDIMVSLGVVHCGQPVAVWGAGETSRSESETPIFIMMDISAAKGCCPGA